MNARTVLKEGCPHQQTGFTLVELMIAMSLSLLLLAALSQAFVYSSRDQSEMENVSRQLESGRYAMRVMTDSFQHAGFFGEFNILASMASATPIVLPAAKPNPCATDLASLRAALPIHVQAYDDDGTAVTCISDVKSNTDVLVVRHTSTCLQTDADCNNIAGAPYFQASLCNSTSELDSPVAANHYRLETNAANLDRTQRDCATQAVPRRFLVQIYFVANNDQPGDGIPTLKRADLANGGFVTQSIANGVENMQLQFGLDYGRDTTGDGVIDSASTDGSPDSYTVNPDTFTCAAPAASACSAVLNWRNVVAVKMNILARSPATTNGHTDAKTYQLGINDAGTYISVGPFSDAYKRHAYQSVVRLNNPASRRQI